MLISAEHITKRFGANLALQDVSLALFEGDIITIIGPNGSGKTTLLSLLLGLLAPDAGTITRKPDLRVGYMPQKITLDPTLPVTVGWFLQLYARKNTTLLHRLADETGIAHLMKHSLQAISGGELQRVMLARALLNSPELLVLDEPAQGVDVTGQAELYDLISRISRERKAAVLMVSHDLHLVMSSTHQVICLNQHICCAGHPHAVRGDPAFIALFGKPVADSLAVYTHHHDHHH